MTTIHMWDKVPGEYTDEPVLEYYAADPDKKTGAACVIFPGGGYVNLASDHEGKQYAEFLNSIGIEAFVCEYRLVPHLFPHMLADARRAVRYVRYHADEYGIDRERIAVMGSSAGGHLAMLVSNYTAPILYEDSDEIDKENARPNATISCYGVAAEPFDSLILGFYRGFTGKDGDFGDFDMYSPVNFVDENTPPAFLWSTSDDNVVNVIHAYKYASRLRQYGIPHEMHVFPSGPHGMGLAGNNPSAKQWPGLLAAWLVQIGYAKL